ncbi:MAG: hypothetical protein DRI61_07300 [Chloroflexi bacterium]|nr:MAG: hypothetical protein DRI61_07300 [Chloroflexota bacterium]RLG35356.1 MAG: hypothetical protein DRN97_00155 [Methanosarcinales archaeon]
MEKNKEFVHEKYLGELEAHAKTLLEICEDYGKEIGELVAAKRGIEAGRIAQGDAEKTMLLGVIRFMLDCYMQK